MKHSKVNLAQQAKLNTCLVAGMLMRFFRIRESKTRLIKRGEGIHELTFQQNAGQSVLIFEPIPGAASNGCACFSEWPFKEDADPDELTICIPIRQGRVGMEAHDTFNSMLWEYMKRFVKPIFKEHGIEIC